MAWFSTEPAFSRIRVETNFGTCFNRRTRDSDKIDRAQLHSVGREDWSMGLVQVQDCSG